MITPSVKHTITLLESLRQNPSGLNAQELIETLDIPRSTFFTLVNSLKALGYIEQSEPRGPYLAGNKLLAWAGSRDLAERELLAAFREEIAFLKRDDDLSQMLNETLLLATPRPHGMLVAEQAASSQRVRVMYEIGQIIPFAECAAGAWFSGDAQTENARRNTYSLFVGNETVELSLPITSDGTTPSSALLLGAPLSRQSAESMLNLLPALHEMAARISYRLGASFYAPFDETAAVTMQPQSDLNEAEMFTFLQGLHVARLACLKPDGTPHVVPVWQAWDGKAFYVAAWEGSMWSHYLEQNPSVSLTVDEPWPPLRRVIVKGQAQPLNEGDFPGGTNALVASLRQRYLGSHPAKAGLDWQAFRINPHTMRGWQGLAV